MFFLSFFRYNDGTVKLRNPNIELMDQDILYHLALGSGSHDLEEMFGDVKVSVLKSNSVNNLNVCFLLSSFAWEAHQSAWKISHTSSWMK